MILIKNLEKEKQRTISLNSKNTIPLSLRKDEFMYLYKNKLRVVDTLRIGEHYVNNYWVADSDIPLIRDGNTFYQEPNYNEVDPEDVLELYFIRGNLLRGRAYYEEYIKVYGKDSPPETLVGYAAYPIPIQQKYGITRYVKPYESFFTSKNCTGEVYPILSKNIYKFNEGRLIGHVVTETYNPIPDRFKFIKNPWNTKIKKASLEHSKVN